jgi:hypothetical protein
MKFRRERPSDSGEPQAPPQPDVAGGAIISPPDGAVLEGDVTVVVEPAAVGAVEIEAAEPGGPWLPAPAPAETFQVVAGGEQVAIVRTRMHAELVAAALEPVAGQAVIVPSGRVPAQAGVPSMVAVDARALGDGPRLLRAVTHGVAGTRFVSAELPVVLDSRPPSVAIVDPVAGRAFAAGMRIAATAEDPGSGVAWLRFEWSRDGHRWTEIATLDAEPFEIAWEHALPPGPCLLRAVACDGGGHESVGLRVHVVLEGEGQPLEPAVASETQAEGPAEPATHAESEGATPAAGRSRWGLYELERLVAERGDSDPDRAEECRAMLFLLRDYAGMDGTIPPEFEDSVLKLFGPFLV